MNEQVTTASLDNQIPAVNLSSEEYKNKILTELAEDNARNEEMARKHQEEKAALEEANFQHWQELVERGKLQAEARINNN